jgi:hypothetical protein
MPEYVGKAALLADINAGYTKFKAQLAPLSEEQLTTPGVNGTWSVKDNVAHLSAWHKVLLTRMLAIRDPAHFENTRTALDVDTLNEQFYQQNKTCPLNDVLAEFDVTHRQIVQILEELTDEQINQPQDWLNGRSLLSNITGNTVEHYEEHSQIIQDWLNRGSHA